MHILQALPYEFKALEPYIDAMTMEIHHDKHHQAYVTNLNTLIQPFPELAEMSPEELIRNIDSIPQEIRQGIINNAGGHLNHTLFWDILTPGGSTRPSDRVQGIIDNSFGSLDELKTKFTDIATKRFGSGWAWLVRNSDGDLEVYSTGNQDTPLLENKTPIFGLDVWEHAYYLKYQNRRPEYIQNFWNILNWDKVDERF